MKALVLSNGRFKEKEIDNTLETLQEIVGGYIEVPFLSKEFNNNGIDIVINEEGRYIEELKPEIAIVDSKTKKIIDIVYGNCVFISHNKNGDTIELNDKQIKFVLQELQMDVTLTYPDKEYNVKALFI